MALPPAFSDREWLARLVGQYQVALAPAECTSTAALLTHLQDAIAELPDPLPLPERLIVAGAIAHLTLTPDRVAPSELFDLLAVLVRQRAEPTNQVRELSHLGTRRALEFIAARYADAALSLSDVARAVDLSQFHLAHLLKKNTGRAFLWHLHTARLEASKRLLHTTGLSVKEIAVRVGYNDSTQFCRHFRRRTGLSPLTYRALVAARKYQTPLS